MSWWKTEGVAGQTFKTKAALEAEIRRRINSAEIGAPLDADDQLFMQDVLEHHYDWENKRGEGVEAIEVRLNYAYGNAQRGLWLLRSDCSEIDISWRVPLMPNGMPKARLNVQYAARYEIADQVAAARAKVSDGDPCPLCGEPLRFREIHADHAGDWPFARIFDTFFEGVDFESVGIEDVTTTQTRFACRELAARWQDYHRERAELVVIHAHENLGKKKDKRA